MAIQSNFPTLKPTLLLDFANTESVDPRITFTRATAATYYDGRTNAKAEENLLLQSQTFNQSTWFKGGVSVTADSAVAPDGTTTAETLTASATTATHYTNQGVTFVAGTYAVSLFAKAGTHNFIQLYFSNQAAFANFNIASGSGAVGTSSGVISSSITDVGNGWYRCNLVFTAVNANAVSFAIVSSASAVRAESWATIGTETVLIWGAQLEQRSSVTAYTATTTQPITRYQPQLMTAASGVPRIDHNPVTGETLGLLIEEQRTNLLTYSAAFEDAAWIKARASITANTTVAPDGTLSADKLVEDTTATNTHLMLFRTGAGTTTNTNPLTASFYFKAAERTAASILIVEGTTYVRLSQVYFDLVAGTATTPTVAGGASGASATISSVGNGWYRCSLAVTLGGADTRVEVRVYTAQNTTSNIYTGDGTSGIFVWGAQLEAGAFPTSYIPTTASQATRNADVASMTGTNFSSWYRADEGTLYAEGLVPPGLSAFPTVGFSISDGTTNNMVSSYAFTNGVYTTVRVGGVSQGDPGVNSAPTVGAAYRFATGIQLNNTISSLNGLIGTADTSLTVPSVNQIRIGANATGGTVANSCIRKLAYYPLRLTNAQLQAITG